MTIQKSDSTLQNFALYEQLNCMIINVLHFELEEKNEWLC